eukprot:XP_001707364.1 Hypothetical protein GL50803_108294 [Giardia lamblia ATCC 50803]
MISSATNPRLRTRPQERGLLVGFLGAPTGNPNSTALLPVQAALVKSIGPVS